MKSCVIVAIDDFAQKIVSVSRNFGSGRFQPTTVISHHLAADHVSSLGYARLGRRGSMHYERAALLRGVYRGDGGQESEEKIGKSAEE